MKNNTKYWVGFNLVKGIGPVRLEKLLGYFGDIQVAWAAKQNQLKVAGLPEKVCQQLIDVRVQVSLEEWEEKIQELGIQVLTWDDPNYPERLRQIPPIPFCPLY